MDGQKRWRNHVVCIQNHEQERRAYRLKTANTHGRADPAVVLLDAYHAFLQALQQGQQPHFPVLTQATREKVLALHGHSDIPPISVLNQSGPGDSTWSQVCTLVDTYRAVFPVETPGLVVGMRGDNYLLESAFYALVQKRDWMALGSWEELRDIVDMKHSSSVLIFGTPQTLIPGTMLQIARFLSYEEQARRWMTVPYGFMTAPSLDNLLYILYKNMYYPQFLQEKVLFLNALALNRKHYADPHVDLITRDECTQEKVQELLAVHRELTVFSGHGHEDCLFLGKLSIFPSSIREGNVLDLSQPLSAYMRGEVEHDVVFTDHFKTKYLFANTCCGLHIANGLFPSEFTVGSGFLEGSVAAYISTFMLKDNSEHEALLFSRLAQEKGMCLGEAVRIVNNLLLQNTSDFPCYLLIGDPEGRFATAQTQAVQGEITWDGDDHCEITAETRGGCLVTICLADQPFHHQRPSLEAVCLNGVPTQDDLYYLSHEDRCFLYATKQIASGTIALRFACVKGASLAQKFYAIDRYPQRVEFLNVLRVFDQKYKGVAEDMNNSIKACGSVYASAGYSLKQSEKYYKLIKRLEHNFHSLQEALLGTYLAKVEKGSWAFTETYSHDFLPLSRCLLAQPCIFCGNPLLQKKIVHPAYRELIREITICPRCGIISDKPPSTFSVSLRGPESVSQGDVLTRQVTFTNTDEDVQLVTCGLGVERTKLAVYPFHVRKALHTQLVQPGETIEIPFEIEIHQQCVAHSFYLKVFLLANFEVACLQSVLFILPKG